MFKSFSAALVLLLVSLPASAKPHPRLRRLIPRVWDKHFWIATAIQTAAMVADVETTVAARNRHDLGESNPLLGKRPSRLELYSVEGAIEGGVLWGEYTLKDMSMDGSSQDRSMYHALIVIQTGIHAAGAIHNGIILSASSRSQTPTIPGGAAYKLGFLRSLHTCPAYVAGCQ